MTTDNKAAAPDVERLIAARNKLVIAVRDLRGGYPARQDDVDLAIAELDIEIVKVRGALSAAHTREAEREAIFEAVVDALEGRNVSDFMESFPAVRLALDARAREAALRAENERLKAHVARLESALKLVAKDEPKDEWAEFDGSVQ